MTENVLYKKTYEHMTDEDYRKLFDSITPEKLNNIKKRVAKFNKNIKYVKIVEKDAVMRPFVQGAINFSNDFSVDVEIVQRDTEITVCFSFEDVTVFTALKDVMALSDEIIIGKNPSNGKIELILEFTTHMIESKNG